MSTLVQILKWNRAQGRTEKPEDGPHLKKYKIKRICVSLNQECHRQTICLCRTNSHPTPLNAVKWSSFQRFASTDTIYIDFRASETLHEMFFSFGNI